MANEERVRKKRLKYAILLQKNKAVLIKKIEDKLVLFARVEAQKGRGFNLPEAIATVHKKVDKMNMVQLKELEKSFITSFDLTNSIGMPIVTLLQAIDSISSSSEKKQESSQPPSIPPVPTVERIREVFSSLPPKYPTDAEETQRLIREVREGKHNSGSSCVFDKSLVKSGLIEGCANGFAGGVGEAARLVVTTASALGPQGVMIATPIAALDIIKETIEGCLQGAAFGSMDAINKHNICVADELHKKAYNLVKDSYVTPASRKRAVEVIEGELRDANKKKPRP